MALLSAYQDRMSNSQKGVLFGLAAVGTSAVVNSYMSSKAENDNPPIGKFVEVNGVRLHYVEIGKGDPVVFLHGNGSMIQDFASSGLLDLAAKSHRVIAFDRPGCGRSELTHDRAWTPAAQAKLLRAAFNRLSIEKPTVVGHSWGTLVALRLAVDFRNDISRLVLLSGYYFSTVRADTWLSTPGSLPLLGPTPIAIEPRLELGALAKLVRLRCKRLVEVRAIQHLLGASGVQRHQQLRGTPRTAATWVVARIRVDHRRPVARVGERNRLGNRHQSLAEPPPHGPGFRRDLVGSAAFSLWAPWFIASLCFAAIFSAMGVHIS